MGTIHPSSVRDYFLCLFVDNVADLDALSVTVIFLTLYTLSSTLHVFQTYMKNSPRFMIISAVGGYSPYFFSGMMPHRGER